MRRTVASALFAASIALGACGPVNRGLESVNQPVVSRTDYVFDASAGALRVASPDEMRRLADWFDALQLGYGDRVTIDERSSYPDGAVRDAVSGVLARHGLLLSEAAPVTSGEVPPGAVRIVVSRTSASVPNCPNWQRKSQPEFASSTMSNYGCATNTNLAAMIANPADLVRGQIGDDTDARSVNKAIKTYRDAAPTGNGTLKTEATRGGN